MLENALLSDRYGYCPAALNECEIFGCNEESGECVCNTSSNCLASFNFTSLEECQDNIKGEAELPSPTLVCKKNSSNHSSNSICLPSPIQSRLVIQLSVPMCGVALYCSTLLRESAVPSALLFLLSTFLLSTSPPHVSRKTVATTAMEILGRGARVSLAPVKLDWLSAQPCNVLLPRVPAPYCCPATAVQCALLTPYYPLWSSSNHTLPALFVRKMVWCIRTGRAGTLTRATLASVASVMKARPCVCTDSVVSLNVTIQCTLKTLAAQPVLVSILVSLAFP